VCCSSDHLRTAKSTNKTSAVTTSPDSAVQHVEAEQPNPRLTVSRIAQADVEACPAVAGQLRRIRVVPLDREQVPSPEEPFNMANGLTERQHLSQ